MDGKNPADVLFLNSGRLQKPQTSQLGKDVTESSSIPMKERVDRSPGAGGPCTITQPIMVQRMVHTDTVQAAHLLVFTPWSKQTPPQMSWWHLSPGSVEKCQTGPADPEASKEEVRVLIKGQLAFSCVLPTDKSHLFSKHTQPGQQTHNKVIQSSGIKLGRLAGHLETAQATCKVGSRRHLVEPPSCKPDPFPMQPLENILQKNFWKHEEIE